MPNVKMDGQNEITRLPVAVGRRHWPLVWWQIILAIAVLSHTKYALEAALFPSTSARPFSDNIISLGEFAPMTLSSVAHFFAVGSAMALMIRSFKETVDLPAVFSSLLLVQGANLLATFIVWQIVSGGFLLDSLQWGQLYSLRHLGLAVLAVILVLVSRFAGRTSWIHALAVAAMGVTVSYLFVFLWLALLSGWNTFNVFSAYNWTLGL
jgi:hypothetical protein